MALMDMKSVTSFILSGSMGGSHPYILESFSLFLNLLKSSILGFYILPETIYLKLADA